MAYPALPICTVRQAGETMPEYAARVLRFLLATDTTATLTDEQLSLADGAAQRCAAQLKGGGDPTRADRPDRPSTLDAPQLLTIETLSAARRTIALVLDWRRQDDQRRATAPLIPPSQHPQPGTQGGRPAMLHPPPPGGPGSPDALCPLCGNAHSSEHSCEPRTWTYTPPVRRPADGIRF